MELFITFLVIISFSVWLMINKKSNTALNSSAENLGTGNLDKVTKTQYFVYLFQKMQFLIKRFIYREDKQMCYVSSIEDV